MNDNLIPLQAAHVTQYTDSGEKGVWLVRKNGTSEDLAKLPKDLTEAEVFAALDFAREFELQALNIGIRHGLAMAKEQMERLTTNTKQLIGNLTSENERLSAALIKEISKGE